MVEVHWRALERDSHPAWSDKRALYAYATPSAREILYNGKADRCTIRERWNAPDKQSFWRALERDRRVYNHVVYAGSVNVPWGSRLTCELLSDIESLLIYLLEPWGNIQCSQSRLCRPGMTVKCTGEWPLSQCLFRDGEAPRVLPSARRGSGLKEKMRR